MNELEQKSQRAFAALQTAMGTTHPQDIMLAEREYAHLVMACLRRPADPRYVAQVGIAIPTLFALAQKKSFEFGVSQGYVTLMEKNRDLPQLQEAQFEQQMLVINKELDKVPELLKQYL